MIKSLSWRLARGPAAGSCDARELVAQVRPDGLGQGRQSADDLGVLGGQIASFAGIGGQVEKRLSLARYLLPMPAGDGIHRRVRDRQRLVSTMAGGFAASAGKTPVGQIRMVEVEFSATCADRMEFFAGVEE